MQRILDRIFDIEYYQTEALMTEEEIRLDEKLRESLKGELLENYLKIMDLLSSDRVEGERRQYKKGFEDGLKLDKEIEYIKNRP